MNPGEKLRAAVERAVPRLEAISEETASRAPAGKWSPKEILGHLIDSASNNHGRFVRAQFQEDLVFPGYQQEEWVSTQRYREAAWPSLIVLWKEFNLHLARVMDVIDPELRNRPRTKHALDRIAWTTVPADTPATLEYFMHDYVAHMEHHLGQVWERSGV